MPSKLVLNSNYEAENTSEVCIREAFEHLESELRPPFPLTIPSLSQYPQLNQAILYGALSEPHFFQVHLKHLHAIVVDGYAFFMNLLTKIVSELYVKLLPEARIQLILVVSEMVDVLANGLDGLLISLLRQIVGGDFSDGNLWLCFELVRLFMRKWDTLVEEEPSILASALYTYLRLLSDHCRPLNNPKLVELKDTEIQFCIKVLQEKFNICLGIGRDLVRLLQDLVHVPAFRDIWKKLLLYPSEFGVPNFSDISQIYYSRTPSNYFILRVTPEMETRMRFLLTHVKLGNQRRYQEWFARKFLHVPDREIIICDIVRFVCCAHHPPNEIIQSDIIPRWAVIGWLLKCCRKKHVEANAKLALFYDWLFFDERVDNVMNIEPAILLMVNSIPKYIDMTHYLLDFLLLLADNYDTERLEIIHRGVLSSFTCLVRKGVVRSLDVLTSSEILFPFLKDRLRRFLLGKQPGILGELLPTHGTSHSVQAPFSLQCTSNRETLEQRGEIASVTAARDKCISTLSVDQDRVGPVVSLISGLSGSLQRSSTSIHELLQRMICMLADIGNPAERSGSLMSPALLASKLAEESELDGYKVFAPLNHVDPCYDDETGSLTALIISLFIVSLHEKMQCMLLHWSRNGRPVGARLLSFASRLALEASLLVHMKGEESEHSLDDPRLSLIKFYINARASYLNVGKQDLLGSLSSVSEPKVIFQLVEGAFSAYKSFHLLSANYSHENANTCLKSLFLHDLITCSGWVEKCLKSLFCSIFCYLPALSSGSNDVIRLLVDRLDHASLLEIQYETSLRRFSVFGDDSSTICHLIKESITWGCIEQYKLWGLIRSELGVSHVKLESILVDFFCSDNINSSMAAIAVEGFVILCMSRAPTTELVGAVILLPNKIFENFASMILMHWSISHPSMLLTNLSCLLEKFEDRNSPLSLGFIMNTATIRWLSNYFHVIDFKGNGILRKAPEDLHVTAAKNA